MANTNTPQPDDLQMILLTIAARRKEGLIHPLPVAAGKDAAAIETALAALLDAGLVCEVPVRIKRQVWRETDGERIGLAVTDAGRTVVETDLGEAEAERGQTKTDLVLALLRRDQGATLEDLVAATGWLPHTTRAALTGLRKKGHAITSEKVDDVRRYRIVESQSTRNDPSGDSG